MRQQALIIVALQLHLVIVRVDSVLFSFILENVVMATERREMNLGRIANVMIRVPSFHLIKSRECLLKLIFNLMELLLCKREIHLSLRRISEHLTAAETV